MPLDASIILNAGKGVVPLQDPNAIADAAATRQLNQMKLQQAGQSLADDQTYRQTLMSTPSDQLPGALYSAGLGKQAQEAQKFQTDQQTAQGNRGKLVAEGMKNGAASILANPTEDNAIATLTQTAQQYGLPQQIVDSAKARIYAAKNDPGQLKQLAVGWGGDAEKVLGKFTSTDTGGQIVQAQTNPVSGAVTTGGVINKTQSPDNVANNARSAANNANTIAAENTRAGIGANGQPTADVESMAQGIASGKIAPLSGYSLARPAGQAIMARVMDINPTYDAADWGARQAAVKGFSTGKEGTALRSFNVASDHLDTLGQMADALNNGSTPLLNKIGNAWNQQTGNPAPTDFNAVKEIVGKEVVKAIVAGGGGVGEREEMSRLMDAANSPAQLKGVITHFKDLMDAQKAGLMDQYQRTTGRADGATVFAPSKPAANTLAGGKAADTSAMEAELRRRGLIK